MTSDNLVETVMQGADRAVPLLDIDSDLPTVMINAFSMPEEDAGLFLGMWKDNAREMAQQPGFVRSTMHRALSAKAELRFVNVAEWATGADLNRARKNPAWREAAQRILNEPRLHVTARPMIYEIAIDVRPGDRL